MKLNEIVTDHFSEIFEENLLHEISSNGIFKNAEPDKIILEIRREIKFIPLIVSGVVKVMRRDGKGNGVFLHYLSGKQSSAISISYALVNKKSEIRLKAESQVTYISIPSKVVNLWLSKYDSWRSYYLEQNQQQISKLIENINDVHFTSLEFRLLKYLEYNCSIHNTNTICKKHFDIARDLKVSREAISRALKKLEKEDTLSLGRNKITLN